MSKRDEQPSWAAKWFVLFDLALRKGNLRVAGEAQEQLRNVGFDVKFLVQQHSRTSARGRC